MRIAWTTDLHLNFVDAARIDRLIEELRDSQSDAVLIGGDTGEAVSFARHLKRIADALEVPVYFVLGNHDYYHSSIANVRRVARTLSQQYVLLTWLSEIGPIWLTEETAPGWSWRLGGCPGGRLLEFGDPIE